MDDVCVCGSWADVVNVSDERLRVDLLHVTTTNIIHSAACHTY